MFQMDHFKPLTMLIFILIFFQTISRQICQEIETNKILNGVTIESSPFLMTNNNRFQGLCVEIMDEIQRRTGLRYALHLVDENNKFYGPIGSKHDGRPAGLIGEIFYGKADFAIADMTILPRREKYVQFTRPFFSFSVSGLIHKSNKKNLKTIADLAIKSNLSCGVYEQSNTFMSMSKKRDVRNIHWLYERIIANRSNFLHTHDEVIKKVKNEKFVFLQEEPRNAFLASLDCDLTLLYDPNFYIFGQYAIALPYDSPYLTPFNIALERMEKEGFLTVLKAKYFLHTKCSSGYRIYSKNIILTILFLLSILNLFIF